MVTVNTKWITLLAQASLLILGLSGGNGVNGEDSNFEHVKGRIYSRAITISGSGAGFAQILHLSHAKMFSGVGLFAGAYYKCGGTSETFEELYSKCGVPGGFPTNGLSPEPNATSSKAALVTLKSYEWQKLVDPLTSLNDQRVWIWIASMDEWVPTRASAGIVDIYEQYLNKPTQIRSVIQSSTHHLPTLSYGAKCDQKSEAENDALLGNCNYDGPREMLNFLLSTDSFQVLKPKKDGKLNKLLEFDQTQFYSDFDPKVISLDERGYIYVPSKCETKESRCYLHFYFHECFVSRGEVGERHVVESGFLEVAEANGIIVVFPQTKKTEKNPHACWDFFGYTGTDFANKEGIQVRAVRRMINRFLN